MKKVTVFWFRRDLRLEDNAGLYHALKGPHPVLPLFIFDTHILEKLEDPRDRRMTFLSSTLHSLHVQLQKLHSSLCVKYGTPLNAWQELLTEFDVMEVFANEDYEPYARERDDSIQNLIEKRGISFRSFKDQVIFSKDEVLKDNGEPYTVFTPFSKKWKAKVNAFYLSSYPTLRYKANFLSWKGSGIPSLASMGFEKVDFDFPPAKMSRDVIAAYDKRRDFPAQQGTSHLGIHLRFGTISIRELTRHAFSLNDTFLNEIIWRDFYQMILWHFPSAEHHAFKPAYDRIKWRYDEDEFAAWCEGRTGYPIVDAGMHELNETGFMHNRVRMVTASFLAKHLLIDWRWGEAYFAKKLLDYDLAANNGGWQWAAGCGTDAAPYFRIFNPALQTKKFDPKLEYIKKWVPSFQELSYPRPIVEHEFARKRCLEAYKAALKE